MISDIDKVNDYRMIQAGANHFLPIILKMKQTTLSRIISKYKDGERDFVGEAAELSVLSDLEVQIKQNKSNLTNTEQRMANERINK